MTGTSIKIRALVCPHCGAKLRWNRDVPIIECRYCHTNVVVDTGQRTDRAAEVVSRASTRPFVLVGVLFVSAVIATSIVLSARRARSPHSTASAPSKTSTVAQLIATPLRATPEQVASRHGVAVHDTTVMIHLADGAFREAAFYWQKPALDHVHSITLWPRQDGELTEVVDRARALLGRRLRPAATGGYQFHAKNVSFMVSTTVQIVASIDAGPGWQEQLAPMWAVMKASAFGTGDTLDDHARRDVLNLAYPLMVLDDIGLDVIVDDAEREVHRVAPGADSDGPRHTIGLDHPWFESANLRWDNQPRGAWTGVTLYFAKEFDFAAHHEELVACVGPVLGEPKKLVSDHLAGTFTLQFRAHGGRPWVDVGPQTFSFYPRNYVGDPVTADGMHALVSALAACGHSPT